MALSERTYRLAEIPRPSTDDFDAGIEAVAEKLTTYSSFAHGLNNLVHQQPRREVVQFLAHASEIATVFAPQHVTAEEFRFLDPQRLRSLMQGLYLGALTALNVHGKVLALGEMLEEVVDLTPDKKDRERTRLLQSATVVKGTLLSATGRATFDDVYNRLPEKGLFTIGFGTVVLNTLRLHDEAILDKRHEDAELARVAHVEGIESIEDTFLFASAERPGMNWDEASLKELHDPRNKD